MHETVREYVRRETLARARADEALVRDLLGLWVSELEPAIARRQGTHEILGLTWADDPECRILITPWDLIARSFDHG